MEERKINIPATGKDIRFGIGEIGLGLGIIGGILVNIVGTIFDNHFYPCLYFYWGNLGLIFSFGTFMIVVLQIHFSFGSDSFLSGIWKIHNERRKLVSNKNFKFGQKRYAGFRLCYTDLAMIGITILTTILLQYFSKNNTLLQIVALLPIIVVVHLFLFYNVFRISRRKEIIWSFIFMMNVIFWTFIYQGIFNLWTYWRSVLLMQTPYTMFIILYQVFSTKYRGIGYNLVAWSDYFTIPNDSITDKPSKL
jgi:dipeptide/tripeptide permease